MIQLNPLQSTGAIDGARQTGNSSAATRHFARALAQAKAPADDAEAVRRPAATPLQDSSARSDEATAERQDLAATGTILPDESVDMPKDEPEADARALPLELLAIPAPIVVDVVETAPPPLAPAALPTVTGQATPPGTIATATPFVAVETPAAETPADQSQPFQAELQQPQRPPRTTGLQAIVDALAEREPVVPRVSIQNAVIQPAPQIALVPAQPTHHLAVQAMFDGGQTGDFQRDESGDAPEMIVPSLHGVTTHAPGQSVAPVAAPQSLDLGRRDWMEQMIERIDTLQSQGGARETRIRLTPDALGAIDVSISHDEGGVRIHIATDTALARAMLADAAPRLTEMAELRGLRLSQANVDPGTAGDGQGQRDPRDADARASTRPSPTITAANDDDGISIDSRIA